MKTQLTSLVKKITDKYGNSVINILQEEIMFVNKYCPNEWSLSLKSRNEYLRILCGPYIIFTLSNDYIWTCLDKYFSSSNKGIENYSFWKWDDHDYPEYKRKCAPTRNGYFYTFSENNWELIKDLHFETIRKISVERYALNENTKKNHDNCIIDTLIYLGNKDLPYPLYSVEKELNEFKDEQNLEENVFENIQNIFGDTEIMAFVKSRRGQQNFRNRLLNKYKKCLICGIEKPELLRASHIKPWAKSTNEERMLIENGLLLCANHDALFDKGLISFDEYGQILISKKLPKSDLALLSISNSQINICEIGKSFMHYHRENIYENPKSKI